MTEVQEIVKNKMIHSVIRNEPVLLKRIRFGTHGIVLLFVLPHFVIVHINW